MMKKAFIPIIIVLASVLVIFGLFRRKEDKAIRLLPIYGENQVINGDTVFHTVPDFQFINQYGKTVNQETFKNKIYVTDFFFTTCGSICPVMSSNLKLVAQAFEQDTNILLLSHTVNPEYDTVQVLADYAALHQAKEGRWHFVTGDKKELYRIARQGYYLDAQEGDGGPEDFLHTPNFALIDPAHRIRGYYDGTKEKDILKLIADIRLLRKEQKLPDTPVNEVTFEKTTETETNNATEENPSK